LEHVPRLLQSLYQIEQLPQLNPKTTLQMAWHGAWGIYCLPGLIRAWQQGLGRDYRLESHSFPPEEALELFSLGLLDFWIGSWSVNQTECLNTQAFKALGLQLYTGQASDCLIAGQPRPQSHWQELEYIALMPFTFALSLWNEQQFPRQLAVCLSSVSDALALAQQSLLALYLPEVFLAEALAKKSLAMIAQAPAHHSLTPGIVLNPHSLGSWLPALEQIVTEAGYRLYAA
jgi:DNA-binding transcriptional LysR family regulator